MFIIVVIVIKDACQPGLGACGASVSSPGRDNVCDVLLTGSGGHSRSQSMQQKSGSGRFGHRNTGSMGSGSDFGSGSYTPRSTGGGELSQPGSARTTGDSIPGTGVQFGTPRSSSRKPVTGGIQCHAQKKMFVLGLYCAQHPCKKSHDSEGLMMGHSAVQQWGMGLDMPVEPPKQGARKCPQFLNIFKVMCTLSAITGLLHHNYLKYSTTSVLLASLSFVIHIVMSSCLLSGQSMPAVFVGSAEGLHNPIPADLGFI